VEASSAVINSTKEKFCSSDIHTESTCSIAPRP
jgi:hypothetical protein